MGKKKNKREFIVYNDIHAYGRHQIQVPNEPLTEWHIFNGDIFDLAGCEKSKINEVLDKMKGLRNALGTRYIYGNHELMMDHIDDQHVHGQILFTHGHLEFWGRKKSLKYMRKLPGRGKFGRKMAGWFDKLRMYKPFNMSEKQKVRCWERCMENRCQAIVLGHKHPKEPHELHYTRDGKTIRIFVLPRGRHVLQL